MSDFDLEAVRARQAAARAAAALELDDPDLTHLDKQAVVDCPLCDDFGYRRHHVCDHRDHSAATVHGRALVQAELAKIRQRKTGAAS